MSLTVNILVLIFKTATDFFFSKQTFFVVNNIKHCGVILHYFVRSSSYDIPDWATVNLPKQDLNLDFDDSKFLSVEIIEEMM